MKKFKIVNFDKKFCESSKIKGVCPTKNTMLKTKVKIPNLIYQNRYVNKIQQTNIICLQLVSII